MKLDEEFIFLVPSLEQPRIVKRIIEKSKAIKDVKVYGFKRPLYQVNNFDKVKEYPNIEVKIINNLNNEKYFGRIFSYMKLILKLYFDFGLKRKNIYAFGLDLRIISCLIINSEIYYEISDIMWLYKFGLTRKLLMYVDACLSKRSIQVIFTSERFYTRYYNFLNSNKILVLENKFKSYNKVFPLQTIKEDKIRIAYIGAFRYETIIKYLIEVCSANIEKLDLRFYGDGPNRIIEEIKNSTISNANIYYYGAFKNPDDLGSVYSENNVNFAAYDNTLENEQVAMPNKFYESGFFNIPIVCSENTFVGEKVKELNMGWVINPTKEGIETFFNNLTLDNVLNCHNNIKKLNKSKFEFEN